MGATLFDDSVEPLRFSLSQFTTLISREVNASPQLSRKWVMAELSDVRVVAGHCYMELVEKSSDGKTVAKMRATIWQSVFLPLRQKFYRVTGKDITTGMKVLLQGSASHHSLYGISFNVHDINPEFTLGDISRIRREILEKLTREGILDNNKNLDLPVLPQKIAVISAEGAAGYGDFVDQLINNENGFVFYPILYPSVMQGDKVASSVIRSLDMVASAAGSWDMVVILRGGGATTDLLGFDNYELARKVALFPIPVVVAIGHERDRTVLDEIARVRVKTPTAAASFFLECARQAEDMVLNYMDLITRYVNDRISGENTRIANFSVMLPAMVGNKLNNAEALLNKELIRIPSLVGGRIQSEYARLSGFPNLVSNLAKQIVDKDLQKQATVKSQLETGVNNAIARNNLILQKLIGIIDALNPKNTMKRGYSIVRNNGKAVSDASQLKSGDSLTVEFSNGTIETTVK